MKKTSQIIVGAGVENSDVSHRALKMSFLVSHGSTDYPEASAARCA